MAPAKGGSTHEDYARKNDVKMGSNRSFGIVFAVVFAIIGLAPLWGGGPVRIWAVSIAATFLAVALIYPAALASLNRLWFRFGMLLNRITTPLIMGLLFYVTVTPTALIMRALGKDPLRLKLDPSAKTYWIAREPPGPAPDSIKQQF